MGISDSKQTLMFSLWQRDHYVELRKFLTAKLKSEEDAADVMQDTVCAFSVCVHHKTFVSRVPSFQDCAQFDDRQTPTPTPAYSSSNRRVGLR